MIVDFFSQACSETTNAQSFGICDDVPNSRAYLDITDSTKWIAIVDNPKTYEVTFIGIDNCVQILRSNGETESRCDGMVKYLDNIIFIELKERDSAPTAWIEKGYNQLKVTINIFKNNYNISDYASVKAHLVNSMRPNFPMSQISKIQRFFTETGVILDVKQLIELK